MPHRRKPRRPERTGRTLLFLFSVTVLVPGLVLGVFGFLRLARERQYAEQEVRERFNTVAGSLGRRLELEWNEWEKTAENLSRVDSRDPAAWPERLREAVAQPGAAVVLFGTREHVQVYPPGQTLYALSPINDDSRLSPVALRLSDAEAAEYGKHYDRAIELYRKRLDSPERTVALNGLARTLANAGRTQEAVATYRLLEKEPAIRIGPFPSDLLALHQTAKLEASSTRIDDARRLYQGLVDGRWLVDREVYEAYSLDARNWLDQDRESFALRETEDRKLALTRAAERLLESSGSLDVTESGTAVLFRSSQALAAAIVLGASYVEAHFLANGDNADTEIALAEKDPEDGIPFGAYVLKGTNPPVQLQVRSRNPEAFYSAIDRQRNLYVAMLAILIAMLAVGGYFTIRTLRSEIAVAQMKSDFVSTVSHEFRSPLAGINQLAEMLRDGRVPEDSRRNEYYGMIVAETQRLRRLVENVLDFARMEDGRKQYRFESVEPSALLHQIAEDFQTEVAGRGFAVEANIPDRLPDILADRETLSTAIHNLLDNAVKYSRDSRSVRLYARSSGQGLSISVCDRGAGIPEEDRHRIFEKFFRGSGDLTRQVKGVGLGLNIVQHIVAAHGGSIEVDSKEGDGSTFTIHLRNGERSA